MGVQELIAAFEQKYETVLHPSYREFLIASVELYGREPTENIDMDALVAWPEVSLPGTAADEPEVHSIEYWLKDMGQLWGLKSIGLEIDDEYQWSKALMKHGYPIGTGYDGSLFIQASTGECFHTQGDEWLEDKDHEELAALSAEEFFAEWGHHPLAADFREFYRRLCEQRGCR